MEVQTLKAAVRTLTGRKTHQLRDAEQVPAVVYGAGMTPKNVTVDRKALVRLYKAAGESSLVELAVEGEKAPVNVLIQDLQYDPLRNEITHADFRAVDMTKKIEAEVKLIFIGESAAVKGLGGTLVRPIESLKIRALPKDLLNQITVDISSLATFEDAIHVKDLVVPEGVELVESMDQTVALVAAPRSEEELAALNQAVDTGDVSKIEKVETKKKEDEEAAEGAAAGAEKKPEAKKEEKK